MHHQRFTFALLMSGIPALLSPASGFSQEPAAPGSQQEAAEVERLEVEVDVDESTDEGDNSDRSRWRGPLALSGNEAAAEWVLPTQQSIIELAETARENAKSDEVRSFAGTLHAEHTAFVEQIKESVAADAELRRQEREERRRRRLENREERNGRRGDTDSDAADGEEREEQRRIVLERLGERAERVIARAEDALGDVVDDAAARASRRLRAAARGFPWIQTQQQTAQNVLAIAKDDLDARQGFEFDQVYLGYASAQHAQAIAELKAVEPETSAETQQLIQDALAKMERHRQTAGQLMKQVSANVR